MKDDNTISIAKHIRTQIQLMNVGEIFFCESFDVLDKQAIRVVLSRIVKEGTIVRLGPGIYQVPRYSKILGSIAYPTLNEIACAIAQNEQSRIKASGSYALYKIGLTTQVPTRAVFLTDGSPRRISLVGGRSMLLKKTTAKNLSYKSEIISLTVSALKEIGKDSITDEVLSVITQYIKKEDKYLFTHDVQLGPEWIGKLLVELFYN